LALPFITKLKTWIVRKKKKLKTETPTRKSVTKPKDSSKNLYQFSPLKSQIKEPDLHQEPKNLMKMTNNLMQMTKNHIQTTNNHPWNNFTLDIEELMKPFSIL